MDDPAERGEERRSQFPSGIRYGRWLNIGVRTTHIGVTGVLFGGHVFGMPENRLWGWLYGAIATGAVLIVLEAYPRLYWLHQGRGLMVLTKLALMCLVPICWPYRAYIMALIVVLASVGSHMPARYRYYSILERRMLDH